jgi:signal transduction histidine kinase
MAMRPLEKLPTIRSKLGSVIVLAVAVTLLISYLIIGFALRNSTRSQEMLRTLQIAARVAAGDRRVDGDTKVVIRNGLGNQETFGADIDVEVPGFQDRTPHWGLIGRITYASVPTADGGWVTVSRLVPPPGRTTAGRVESTLAFLASMWWQFTLAGLVAAVIALLMARWLAKGMTKPLRDMVAAARRMEVGDYAVRVQAKSRDEVGRLAQAFNRMSEELAHLEASRRDLVANVSHELKTPIAAIRAHLENLLDGVEEPDPATLQVMLGQSERLGRLVEQLLDLSKLESGEVPLHREDVEVAPLVARVVSEFAVARDAAQVKIERDIDRDLPPLDADAERVHQVLYNLVDNAVRFSAPGGEVTISAHRHNGSVEFKVVDTGTGIAPEHLPRLFERFYRVDAARSRDDGGTGIGLAIARSVVEAHGGRIRAESQPGRGSVFTFDLPAAADRRDP